MDMNLNKVQEMVKAREAWCASVHEISKGWQDLATEQQQQQGLYNAFKREFDGSTSSLIAQLIKNLPAMQETPVCLLGQEDPLEKGQVTHSSILGLSLWLSL